MSDFLINGGLILTYLMIAARFEANDLFGKLYVENNKLNLIR